MIARWLLALRVWWHAPVLARLAALDDRLTRAFRVLRIDAPVLEEKTWGCGHTHVTGAYRRDDTTECIDCHEERQ